MRLLGRVWSRALRRRRHTPRQFTCLLPIEGDTPPVAVEVHASLSEWSWPLPDARRVLVVLPAGCDPLAAMRLAVTAGAVCEKRISIAVVGGAAYWPQWASVDTAFWLPFEDVREDTFRRSAVHVPDDVELRLIDAPGWDAVRNDLLTREHDLVICAITQRWAGRALKAVAAAPVIVIGAQGVLDRASSPRTRPTSQP